MGLFIPYFGLDVSQARVTSYAGLRKMQSAFTTRSVSEGCAISQNPSLTRRVVIKVASR
jgi:hypothetical protein